MVKRDVLRIYEREKNLDHALDAEKRSQRWPVPRVLAELTYPGLCQPRLGGECALARYQPGWMKLTAHNHNPRPPPVQLRVGRSTDEPAELASVLSLLPHYGQKYLRCPMLECLISLGYIVWVKWPLSIQEPGALGGKSRRTKLHKHNDITISIAIWFEPERHVLCWYNS